MKVMNKLNMKLITDCCISTPEGLCKCGHLYQESAFLYDNNAHILPKVSVNMAINIKRPPSCVIRMPIYKVHPI